VSNVENTEPGKSVITVFRKYSSTGRTKCWYFSGGKRFNMSEPLAIQQAARGAVQIKTVEDADTHR
jgi:hypothetical protein